MLERGGDHVDSGRCEDASEGGGYGPEEQLRRALAQRRHAEEARRFFEAAPFYRTQYEDNGTVSVCRKAYNYWPTLHAEAATAWRVVSNHPNFEQAERRVLHIASPRVHYDGRGQLARAPTIE